MNHPESLQQQALVKWAAVTRLPPADDIEPGATVGLYLFGVPNGGHRNKITAAILKAEGVKAGVHDLMLPLARQGAIGLWIEMKAGKGKLTEAQEAWRRRMLLAGYQCVTRWDWESAAHHIREYTGC